MNFLKLELDQFSCAKLSVFFSFQTLDAYLCQQAIGIERYNLL
jgi:hypothetical protein